MKFSKRALSAILAAIMLFSCLCIGVAVSAASPATQTVKVYPGDTVKVVFSEDNCYGINGDITYSNRSIFSAVTPVSSPYGIVRDNKFILSNVEKGTLEAAVSVTVSATAAVGSKCDVVFSNCLRVDNNVTLEGPEGYQKSVTIEVVQKPETPTTTTKKPVSDPTKPPVSTSTVKLDLTELNKQIAAAEALVSGEYTATSWTNMQTALQAAIAARSAKTQAAADSAAKALKDAIAALVRLDNTNLQTLIDEVKAFLEKDELSGAKDALTAALAEAEAATKSGDQAAVDAALAKLKTAFDAYKAKLDEMTKVETEIKEVEKIVEVEPTSPFCNIPVHLLWLILLIISLILNVLLIAFIVYGYLQWKKKKEKKEEAPFVTEDLK